MTFRRGQLQCFVTVADEGQLTSAARKLFMAQPAVSHSVAQLEAELGFQLFERHHRGVTLTPAGATFYEPARRAVEASQEAVRAGEALTRASGGTIVFGFLGAPPTLDSPAPLAAFARAQPQIEMRYHELPFPTDPSSAWLADVDVAVCHRPPPDPALWVQTVREEPRAVIVPSDHPFAACDELDATAVLDATFVGLHPAVEPAWAGFWSLDDVRGGPPPAVTDDRAANPQEVLAALLVRDAVTVTPVSVARLLASIAQRHVAVPLSGAAPASISLVGHLDGCNPLVATLTEWAFGRVGADR